MEVGARMNDFYNSGMAQEDEATSRVKPMNRLKGGQAQDKVANSTLMDNEDKLHDFPVRPVCGQN